MKKSLLLTAAAAAILAGCASNRTVTEREYALSDAAASKYGAVFTAMPTYFGGGEGTPVQRGLGSRKAAGIRDTTEAGMAEGCYRALAAALKQFQAAARKNNLSKLLNMQSLSLQKSSTQAAPAGKFYCQIRGSRAGVRLKGDIGY